MAIAEVSGNTKSAQNDAAGTTLAAAAFTNNITNGNLLVATLSYLSDGTTDDATITDSAGNTWSRTESGNTYDASNGIAASIYYTVISAGGGTKPTITASFWTTTLHSVAKSVQYRTVSVQEFSGAASASVLDKHGTNLQSAIGNGTDVLFCPAATQTPTTNGQLIIGFIDQTSGGTGNSSFLSSGTGFTQLSKVATVSPSGYFTQVEYLVQTSAAAVKALWSQAGTSNPSTTLGLFATFKASASGSPYTLTADSGSFTLTGTAATLRAARKLAVASGTYTFSGTDAGLKRGLKIAAGSGTYTFTGTAAALKAARKISAVSGSYSLSGTDAVLRAARKLSVSSGSYSFTGTDTTLTYTPVSGSTYTLVASAGSFVLTGTNAGLKFGHKLAVSSGSFILTGTDVHLIYRQTAPPITGYLRRYLNDRSTENVNEDLLTETTPVGETPDFNETQTYMRRYLNDNV